MNDDKLNFLDHEPKDEPKAEAPAEPEAKAEPADPPKEEAEGTGAVEASPPDAVDEKGRLIPLTALLDERDKARKHREEAEKLRRELEELRKPKERPEAPDVLMDPEGFQRHVSQTVEQRLWNERLNMSEAIVRDRYGDEAVNAAQQAFQERLQRQPALYAELQRQPNPYGWLVEWHKRESFLSEVQDPDKWREQERERIRAELLAEVQSQPSTVPRTVAPPRSLASAPAAARRDERAPGSTFDQIFGD